MAARSTSRSKLDQYSLLLEKVPIAAWKADPDGNIVFATPYMETHLGYDADEITSTHADVLFTAAHPEDLPMLRTAYQALFSQGEPFAIDYRLRHRAGHWSWVEARCDVATEENGTLYAFGKLTDISRRKARERELKGKRTEQIEQNRLMTDLMAFLETTSGSLNFAGLLHKSLLAVKRVLKSDICLAYTAGPDKSVLLPAGQAGLGREEGGFFTSLTIGSTTGDYELMLANTGVSLAPRLADAPLAVELKSFLESAGVRSVCLVPISHGGAVEVLLICGYRKRKGFSSRETDVLARVHRHLENSYFASRLASDLLEGGMKTAQQLEMTEAMSSIDLAILRSSSKEEVIYGALQQFGAVVSNDAMQILEFDPGSRQFSLTAARRDGKIASGGAETYGNTSMSSWSNAVLDVPSYYPRLDKQVALKAFEKNFAADGYKSLFVMPLTWRGELIGVIALAGRRAAAYTPETFGPIRRLAYQLAVALSNTGLVESMQELLVGIVKSMVAALDAKSAWTKGHSERVSALAMEMGERLGLQESELYELRMAALLHDIGKIGTYEQVLDKESRLTDREVTLVRLHPDKTHDIISPVAGLGHVADIARHHHENWDGSGYPDGAKGESIPYLSRVISVADSLDAMMSDRPYRKALTLTEVIHEVSKAAGRQFDPDIVPVAVDLLKARRYAVKSEPEKQRQVRSKKAA